MEDCKQFNMMITKQ